MVDDLEGGAIAGVGPRMLIVEERVGGPFERGVEPSDECTDPEHVAVHSPAKPLLVPVADQTGPRAARVAKDRCRPPGVACWTQGLRWARSNVAGWADIWRVR